MMNDTKVTVIIPAYNVEQYIKKCIKSILNQTYKNLEVIVVDDGSTDNTPAILDDISITDGRMNVIHCTNNGVSAARNTAIELATGNYLTFVDGDDYLESDYIEYMVGVINTYDSDFLISKNCYVKKGELQTVENIENINSDDAIALLLSPRIVVGCWNKFYKRSFLVENNLLFSTKLKYGEGLHFISRCADKAKIITVTEHKGYYYRRNNAYSATTDFKMDKIQNGELALKMIRRDVPLKSDKSKSMMFLHRCMYYAGATTRLRCSKEYESNKAYFKKWLKYNRDRIYKVLLNPYISSYRKALLLVNCISPYWLGRMDIIRRSRIVKSSI